MRKSFLMMALVLMVGIATTFCFSGCDKKKNTGGMSLSAEQSVVMQILE